MFIGYTAGKFASYVTEVETKSFKRFRFVPSGSKRDSIIVVGNQPPDRKIHVCNNRFQVDMFTSSWGRPSSQTVVATSHEKSKGCYCYQPEAKHSASLQLHPQNSIILKLRIIET